MVPIVDSACSIVSPSTSIEARSRKPFLGEPTGREVNLASGYSPASVSSNGTSADSSGTGASISRRDTMRPGPKFKDLELLGFPHQIYVGRGAPDGQVEYLVRKGMVKEEVGADDAVAKVIEAMRQFE